jgi:predicted naringenin-chalcone synthase
MALYAEYAPALALEAIAGLKADVSDVTHLIVASCTGFVAQVWTRFWRNA